MVEVNFGFLCTNVKNQDGRLSAEGIGIRSVSRRSVPTRCPSLAAVIQMRFTAAEIGPKVLDFLILDLDGNAVVEFDPVTFEPDPPHPGDFYSFDGVEFDLDQVDFPKFGDYTMILRIDGVDMHRMLFRVGPTAESVG